MIWDSHGQEQQANAETRFMIQAKGFWGWCVCWMTAGCVGLKFKYFGVRRFFSELKEKMQRDSFLEPTKTSLQMQVFGTFGGLVLGIGHFFLTFHIPFGDFGSSIWITPQENEVREHLYIKAPSFLVFQILGFCWRRRSSFFASDLLNHDLNHKFFWPYFSRGKKHGETPFVFGN